MERLVRSLYGSSRLYRLDPRGLDHFDTTIEGFWRSFLAAAVAAPLFVLIDLVAPSDAASEGWTAGRVALEAVEYAALWAFMPVAAVFVTRFYGVSARYVVYIVALNWNAVISVALIAAVVTAETAIGESLARVISLVLLVYVVYVEWFTTRLALRTAGWIAATFVAIDIVGGVALDMLFDALR